jgi:DNA-binding CsgD family transcriptional regulator
MPSARDDLLAAGERALADGAWADARQAFQGAVEAGDSESGDALLGLATALWWLGELHDAVDYKERAYAAFRRHGDQFGAALTAWQLSIDHWDGLDNAAAAQGWLARTRRLIDEHGLAALWGWVLLLDAHYASDPTECERVSRDVLDLAQESADADLQLCALSQLGAALVDQGRVAEGVRMLDEAMAGSLSGESGRPDAVVFTSCNTLQACSSCADFQRAVQWLRATDRFAQRFGSPYLRADCRIHYATMLKAIGDWTQAEEELSAAITVSVGRLPVLHGDALAALASLRLAQGQVDEAARLVDGLDERPGAAAVIGDVFLRRGRPESARSVLQRGLATLGADRLQAVVLRELLGQALIASGEVAAAAEYGETLADLGATHDCTMATAYGARLCGRAAAAAEDSSGARSHFDAALAAFTELGMPYEAAQTRLLLAQYLRVDSTQSAVDEAKVAFAALDGLGARADADETAALLRDLGASAIRSHTRAADSLTPRETEVLMLLGEGLSNPEIAERLYLSRKTVEHHVARVLAKLGLRSRAEAAATAVRSGQVAE